MMCVECGLLLVQFTRPRRGQEEMLVDSRASAQFRKELRDVLAERASLGPVVLNHALSVSFAGLPLNMKRLARSGPCARLTLTEPLSRDRSRIRIG